VAAQGFLDNSSDGDGGNEDNDSAGSSGEGEDSEGGNDDPMKTGGLIGLANGGMVTVQPGDTLTKIANETGMTVEGLASLNGIPEKLWDKINVGQQLKISAGDSGVEDTTDSKQVEQSDSKERYFNDIVKPLEFSDYLYTDKAQTHFNPETNSYKAYLDSEDELTFGPGVLVDPDFEKLFKGQKFKVGSELPRDVIDKIALKRWDKSIQEAKKLTNLPDDKVKPFAEMVFQLGKPRVASLQK
jgi:LysM repeat protein